MIGYLMGLYAAQRRSRAVEELYRQNAERALEKARERRLEALADAEIERRRLARRTSQKSTAEMIYGPNAYLARRDEAHDRVVQRQRRVECDDTPVHVTHVHHNAGLVPMSMMLGAVLAQPSAPARASTPDPEPTPSRSCDSSSSYSSSSYDSGSSYSSSYDSGSSSSFDSGGSF